MFSDWRPTLEALLPCQATLFSFCFAKKPNKEGANDVAETKPEVLLCFSCVFRSFGWCFCCFFLLSFLFRVVFSVFFPTFFCFHFGGKHYLALLSRGKQFGFHHGHTALGTVPPKWSESKKNISICLLSQFPSLKKVQTFWF